jgi:predicted nucleic acid-binding protein
VSLLLDTSAVIYLHEHGNPKVAALLKAHDRKFSASLVTRGELMRGYRSGHEAAIRTVREFTRTGGKWARIGEDIADRWGELASITPRAVKANDLWVAATSIENGDVLVTGDAALASLVLKFGGVCELVAPVAGKVSEYGALER